MLIPLFVGLHVLVFHGRYRPRENHDNSREHEDDFAVVRSVAVVKEIRRVLRVADYRYAVSMSMHIDFLYTLKVLR